MEFSMNTKEKDKAKELGAIVVLCADLGQYLACFDQKCSIVHLGSLMIRKRNSDFHYKDIRAVSQKNGGIIIGGYIHIDTGGNLNQRVDINTPEAIMFRQDKNELSKQIQSFFEQKISEFSNVIQELSPADELKKYAKLKEQGIITEEEFNAKKQQLLEL